MELPYYSKFLLIAAYLSSYNPAKSDRKFFAKVSKITFCVKKTYRSTKVILMSTHNIGFYEVQAYLVSTPLAITRIPL